MRDFRVVIGLVSAIEGLLTVGFTNSMGAPVAIVWASRSLL